CTSHCAAPLLTMLHEASGVARAHLTVVHAYTSTQRLADVPAEDLRLSRAAAENIVRAGAAGPYRGIVEFTEDPIVSSDVEASPHTSVFDSLATMVMGDRLVK